jgi:hypothetical protein
MRNWKVYTEELVCRRVLDVRVESDLRGEDEEYVETGRLKNLNA